MDTQEALMRCAGYLWLAVIAVLSAGCERLLPITDPVFAEIRMTLKEQPDVKLLVFVKTASNERCEEAIEEWLEEVGDDEEWETTAKKCKKEIKEKYLGTFENNPIHATYIRVDRSGGWSHDARAIIFGVASSHAAAACEEMAVYFQQRLGAKVGCIEGSVG